MTRPSYREAYTQDEDRHFVRFISRFVFVKIGNWFQLDELRVLANGKFEFEGSILEYGDIENALQDRKICTQLPEGSRISIPELAGFHAHDFIGISDESELLQELHDIHNQLNDLPTSSDACREAYKSYTREPSEDNRLALKQAYEAVPSHLRCWLLGFNEKDAPIRRAIYGENWNAQEE